MPCSKKRKITSKRQARKLFAMARRGEISKAKVREMAHRAGGIKHLPEKAGSHRLAIKIATLALALASFLKKI